MVRSRIGLVHVAALVLGVATPARAVTNVVTLPFGGTVPGQGEDIAVSGHVFVKTVHYPGFPNKTISTSYKMDKSSSGVGMTTGMTYPTTGRTKSKFKYVFPTASDPNRITSLAEWCIACCSLSNPCTCCYPVQVHVSFAADGTVQPGESGASAMAPPAAGSCTAVVQVCN